MQDEYDISKGNDAIQVRKSLNSLPEPPARQRNVPKIIELLPGQTKLVCKNHKFATVIDLHEGQFRKSRGSEMLEFECDCGTIYLKKS